MTTVQDLLARLAGLGVSVVAEGSQLRVRGPAGAVPPELRAQLAERKAELLAHLARVPAPLAPRADPTGPAPLTRNQRRLWFLDQLDAGGTAFVMVAPWLLEGEPSLAALRAALAALAQRHTVLRSAIRAEAGEPMLVLLPPDALQLQVERQPGADAAALAVQEAARAFRLAQEPPLRARLVELGQGRWLLLLAVHHIVSDRWSMGVLVRDFAALYDAAATGGRADLPPLPLQFADYAAWEHSALDEMQVAREMAWWREQLHDAPTSLALPLDRPRPAVRGASGATLAFTLPPASAQALHRVARAAGATPFMALLALYAAVLARWSGQETLTIGCPAGSRDRPETHDLVGFFVNNLVLRADLEDAPGLATLLQRFRTRCLDAFAHQALPFDRVVQALNPARALNRAPLFQAMFVLQTAAVAPLRLHGLQVHALPASDGAPELDLNLSMEAQGEGYAGYLHYDADLFDAATMQRFADSFVQLAAAATAQPDAPLATLPLLDAAARAARAAAWVLRQVPPVADTLPALFVAQAARTPDAIAVEQGGLRLRYAELEERSRALAQRLRALGAGSESVVGVATGRTPELIVALLAVLRAGAGYTVLDPAQPPARLAAIAADAGLRLVIAPPGTALPLPPDVECIAAEQRPGTQPLPPVPPGSLAYVCYTSGSTGTPKGVAVAHASLAHHALAIRRAYALAPADRVLQFAAPEFDVAGEEIYPTLLAGATLVLRAPGELQALDAFTSEVVQQALTVLNLPAGFWHAWVRHLADTRTAPPASLRLVVAGSERVAAERLAQWQALAGDRIAWRNAYGPTEATVTATLFDPRERPQLAGETVPIGRPLEGVRTEVLDAGGHPVPAGVVGELVIGGPGVARGYLHRAEETALRFRPDPFDPAQRVFRTGDRARLGADGNLEFVGRADDQVKIRGLRIEPGEIAAVLARHPAVAEATVLATPDETGQPRLVGYAECAPGAADGAGLLEWLRAALPAAMVPAALVVRERLPRTAGGKLDRRALAALAADAAPAAAPVAPRTPAEAQLAAIFAGVLGLPQVSVTANFFDLGGDSIRSLQIVSRARQAGLALTVRQVFEHQSVAALAASLQGGAPVAAQPEEAEGEVPATPIQAWFHEAITQDRHHYQQAVLLAVPPELDEDALRAALLALLAHHPMLRLQLRGEGGGLQQWIGPVPMAAPLRILDLGGLPPAQRDAARGAAFDAAHAGIDLARGPLLQAVLVRPDARLLLTVHHLAVDAVSWSVLLDDLALAYGQAQRGQPVVLPAPTLSYAAWARRLQALAASDELQAEAAQWQSVLQGESVPLVPLSLSPATSGDAQRLQLTLDAATSEALRRLLPASFGARIDEALLVALQRAAGGALRVDVERHGRDALGDGVDVARTVGWFTSVQPVRLPAGSGDVAEELAAAQRALRGVARGGAGYGLLRHLAPSPALRQAMTDVPSAQVLVNYLGDLGAGTVPAETPFVPSDEPLGRLIGPQAPRSHVLELNAGLHDGCLRMEFSFPPAACEPVQALAQRMRQALEQIAAAAREGAGRLPLTPLQQGLLAHSLRDPATYFDQLDIVLEGPLDAAALRSAWTQLLARHEALRAGFDWRDGNAPTQRFDACGPLAWQEQDWRRLDAAQQEKALEELRAADRARGFALDQAPLMRLALLRLGETRHALLWSAHHLLLDGWSVSVALEEVFALYRAALAQQPAELPPAPRFADHVRRVQARDGAAEAAFWRAELAGFEAATPICLPGLAPAGADEAAPGVRELRLDEAQTQALAELARRARVTLGTVVQGAWALLLERYTGQDDVVFGVTVSGRPPDLPGAERMVGMLINTVPARVRIESQRPLLPWLQELLARHLARDQQGGHAALADILRLCDLPAGQELFQTLVLFQNYPEPGLLAAGGLRLAQVQAHEATNFALTLACQPGRMLGLALHHDARIAADAAERMLGHLRNLLLAMAADAEAPLGRFSVLGPAEREALLAVGRGPQLPVDGPLAPGWLAHWARQQPEGIALEAHDGQLTWSQLDRRTDGLAACLAREGVTVGTPVALCLRRSSRLALAFHAVLKAGAVAVPMDAGVPPARLRFMLEDSGARLVLTDAASAAGVTDAGVPLLRLDAVEWPDASWHVPPLSPEAPATLIYTSGSTGQPKGVLNTHGGLRNLLAAQRSLLGLGPADRVLQFASPSFDASAWELAMALGAGATLVLPAPEATRAGPDLAHCLQAQRVTAATLPPTALAVMAEAGLPQLRMLMVAGEACPPELARRWAAGRRFFNGYGPTEASVCAAADEGGGDGRLLPIGRPLPNTEVHLLDRHGEPVPVGVTGELFIGGAGLASGYHARPALTAERFVPHPWQPGTRLYRSGDLGWRLPDGRIQFVGRTDHQVKLRGFRIELGEVEAVLASHPAVRHAAASVRDGRLLAHVAVAAGAADEAQLRTHLRERLPEHMVPARIAVLPGLPMTASGKIDRKALPDPDQPAAAPRAGARPRTEAEQALARIWEQVLGVAQVGLDDAFFDLGGDSILAIQVVARAHQAGLAITLGQLLTPGEQTIAKLAAGLAPTAADAVPEPSADGEPAQLPLTPIQAWFFGLASPEPHHYNQAFLLEVAADTDAGALERAAQALLQHHDALRLRFRRAAGGWVQALQPAQEARTVVGVQQLGPLAGDAARAAIEAACAREQACIDLEQGPLRLLLLRLGPAQPARLLITVHHLAVDAVSWRFLLDDLFSAQAQAAGGKAIVLPARSTPFHAWARQLASQAAGASVRATLAHWRSPRPALARLPLSRREGRSRVEDAVLVRRELAPAATEALLRSVPRRHGASAQDALLAALALAATRTLGGEALLVDLEGHGRDTALPGIDLTRTVGWFTTLAPAVLQAPAAAEAAAVVATVRSTLAALRPLAASYGLLHQTDPAALAGLEPAQVAFNYLGQWDQAWAASPAVRPAREAVASCFAPSTPRPYPLEVSALVLDGRLQVEFSHDPAQLADAVVQRLADAFAAALHSLLEAPEAPVAAPVHGLGPQQAAMLSHVLAHPRSEAYRVQVAATIPGPLDRAAFRAAWQAVVDRHVALRAFFPPGGGQCLADTVSLPWHEEDWRGLDATKVASRWDALVRQQRQEPLDPAVAPLMRFALVQFDEGHRFAWTHHHLLMDGWSMPVLLDELLRTLAGHPPALPAPDFRNWLAWLQAQDAGAARAFWARELAGVSPAGWPSAQDGAGERFGELLRPAPAGLGAALAAQARSQRLTVPVLLMGCWGVLLARRAGRREAVFGLTTALRPPALAGVEAMVGPLINTLPLRVALPAADEPLAPWLLALQRRRAAQLPVAHLPLAEVAQAAGLPPGAALLAATLRVQNYPAGRTAGDGPRFEEVAMVDAWHYPLNLEVVPGDALQLAASYDLAVLSRAEVDTLLDDYCALLQAAAAGAATLRELEDAARGRAP